MADWIASIGYLVDWKRASYLAVIGGFLSMLVTFYYMEILSYAAGFDSGAAVILNAYNVTPSNTILQSLVRAPSLFLAVHITYIMLPFALIMFAIGVLWLFSKGTVKLLAAGLVFSAFAFLLSAAILDIDFPFSAVNIAMPYIGGALSMVSGFYMLLEGLGKPHRRAVQIEINSEQPYSNMLMLSSRLMGRLEGEVRILDMHFDSKAAENLIRLSRNPGKSTSIHVLTKADRLGKNFERSYTDLVEELGNKNITFELRVMNSEDAGQQHERLLIDSARAYKIPPLNIINKKNEHVVSIDHGRAAKRFEFLWNRGTKYEHLHGA